MTKYFHSLAYNADEPKTAVLFPIKKVWKKKAFIHFYERSKIQRNLKRLQGYIKVTGNSLENFLKGSIYYSFIQTLDKFRRLKKEIMKFYCHKNGPFII